MRIVRGVDGSSCGPALTTVAEIGHVGPGGPHHHADRARSIVGDDLWTLSDAGLGRSDVRAPERVDCSGTEVERSLVSCRR